MGELAQNIEMLVVLSRDTDNQIGGLLLTPVNPCGQASTLTPVLSTASRLCGVPWGMAMPLPR
jgi:hypothetical protein